MKRVLVTGGNGFVGRSCLPLLASRGFEIHAVTRRPPPDIAATRWHHENVRDPAEMQALLSSVRPTHLLHLAWCTAPGVFWASPENLDWLHSSVALFRTFEQSGGTRIVATGSCAEYDWTEGTCSERTTPCRPGTLYGRTKLAAAAYLDAMRQASLSTAWARLFFLYGREASEHRIPGVVISALQRNEPAKCSEGTQLRDFLHINDAARGIVSLIDGDITGPVNICSGIATPIRWMAEHVAELMGKRDLLKIGALPMPAHDPPMIVGDNSRLREEVGWCATMTLESGLRDTISGWHSQQ